MSKLNIERGSGELKISFSWRTPTMWFLLFFCLIWDSITLFALFTGAGFFIIFHAIAGLFITWWTLTRFINSTTVTVDRQKLTMKHGPVPWPFSKDKDIPARALVQLYVGKSNVKQNDRHTYKLMAKLDTGAEVKLIDVETDKKLLLDLERTIETYLDIPNDTSLDLNNQGSFEGLNLETMREQMKRLEPIKKWLPKGILNKMEEAEAKMEAESQRRQSGSPMAPREEDWDVSVFYAQIERNRWSYFEERRLDDGEVESLGFVGETHPLRFENGSDRYYPRDQQTGYRFIGGAAQEVEHFIYFTTASGTQFRALRPIGRGWEVYVMEVVDASAFAR